jgi:class 3 adenylate cyclase/tetratricopeptide (TPR) repeat protein
VTIQNLTILFTDIVGSTELSQRMPPDAADDMRRQHFSVLRRAIAEMGGTEVKNLGDGVMAVFGPASASLKCAVVMQQRVDLDNRNRDHPVGLRVGISGGEVIREQDDFFGDAVIEAARLVDMCHGGQILAADVVRMMAGRRSRQDFQPVGELSLKGLPDPVPTIEVLWEPLAASHATTTVQLPSRMAVRPRAGVLGRETELSLLSDATKRIAAGDGREVVLVSGEAGQGKTTLVAEAARRAFDDGACVLFGHCEEDLATPYRLFSEALGHYVAHASEAQILAHVEMHGSELSRLVPGLASRVPDLPPSKATDSDSERYLLFAAVVGLLGTASVDQPVVLVLDDLQWADEGSLLLLRHLTAAEQSMRVLVLGTYRDSELSRSHPLLNALAALRRWSQVSRVQLTGLDDAGVVAIVEALAGYTLDDAAVSLAHAVYRETDGNPFFVSEILRNLSETGAIYQDATGRWVTQGAAAQSALPESVREVIGARVGRLGQRAETILSLAAVIGRDFDLDLLSIASKASEEELLDTLEAAMAVTLVRDLDESPGHFSFSHALIQHTLYDDLGPSRRAAAHRVVAEALEEVCGHRPGNRIGELARHWFNATQPKNLVKALDYSCQAADAALRALDPGDALRYYTQALDLYARGDDPDPVLGIDLAIGLGTAQRQTGDPAFRDTLIDAAHRAADVGDTGRLVAAALANDRGFYSAVGAIDAEKVEILEMAADLLADHNSQRALVLATLCSELAHGSPLERRKALADEAVAIAESLDDDAVMVRVLNHLHVPLQVPSLLEQSLSRTADALVRAERMGDPVQIFWAAQWRAEAAARSGATEEMERCIALHGTMADQLDQPTFTWDQTFVSALPAQIAGDTDRAEELATKALEIGMGCGQPDASVIFGAQLMIVSGQRGTMSDLAPLIEEIAAQTPDISQWLFSSLLAKAHVEGDRTDEALVLLDQFAAADFDLPLDQTWLTGMVDFAEAAIECHDPKHAEPLFERLAPWSDQLPATGGSALGPVSHYLGGLATVLGRYDQADAYFAQASEFSDRIGAKFFAARTDLLWGRMLTERRRPGDWERAQVLLSQARGAAATYGYRNVERRAAAALEQLE